MRRKIIKTVFTDLGIITVYSTRVSADDFVYDVYYPNKLTQAQYKLLTEYMRHIMEGDPAYFFPNEEDVMFITD